MHKALAGALAAALGLAGCGGPQIHEPEVVTATPAMVAICAPNRGGIQGATALAQRHCMAQGANAQIVSRGAECVGLDGEASGSEFAFRCVR